MVDRSYKHDGRLTAHKLAEKRRLLQIEISNLSDKMAVIQAKCTHSNVRREYKGDTGNYDRSDDGYWCDIFCPKCLKSWTVDSSNPEYSNYYNYKEKKK